MAAARIECDAHLFLGGFRLEIKCNLPKNHEGKHVSKVDKSEIVWTGDQANWCEKHENYSYVFPCRKCEEKDLKKKD